ncbi:complex 5-like [Octopus vulgaris]|uniref:Elongator complex protein 5 n=1 Tax=Octopus vulgaris TaxID=6645 RepID=A0AA36BU85_OCTVU|nr:complex 5-like [Octopus vulgaris]
MLENLLRGSEQSKVVLIQDTVKQSGYPLTACFLKFLSTRYEQVHVLLLDPSAECLRNIVPEENISRCIYHNLYSDPLNWLGNADVTVTSTDFIDFLQRKITSSVHNVAVVICSLTSLIIHRSPAYTCQFLEKLGNRHSSPFPDVSIGQVVSLVHQDLHNEYTLKQLRYVSSSVISLLEDSSVNHLTNCNVVHRRLSGKIFKSKEQYQLLNSFELKAVKELQTTNLRPNDRPQVDPTANLTFKLNLSDTEKVARSQQVLPHIQIQNRQQELQSSTMSGQGQIFYEPDDADDFDDEDPDDDLDI